MTYTVKIALTGKALEIMGNQVDVVVDASSFETAGTAGILDALKALKPYSVDALNTGMEVYAIFEGQV